MTRIRPLRPMLAGLVFCLILPATGAAEKLIIGGTGSALGTMRILADAFMKLHPEVSIEVPDSLGSGGGIKALNAGALQIALSSRPLKDKERQAGAKLVTYAKTPFVLVTSNTGAEHNLTSERLVEIFSGAPTSWSGGTAIRIILRAEHDTATKILKSRFSGMDAALAKARKIRGIPVAPSEQDALDTAEELSGALTTATLTALLAEGRSLVPISIDGVAPTLENVAAGRYPMFKTLYMVIGPGVSRDAQDFIRFVQSADGAAILRDTGNLAIAAGA